MSLQQQPEAYLEEIAGRELKVTELQQRKNADMEIKAERISVFQRKLSSSKVQSNIEHTLLTSTTTHRYSDSCLRAALVQSEMR